MNCAELKMPDIVRMEGRETREGGTVEFVYKILHIMTMAQKWYNYIRKHIYSNNTNLQTKHNDTVER